MYLRGLQLSDIPILAQIEQDIQAYPWTENMFRDCLENPYESFILEENHDVIAYLITQVVLDECHILTLGVEKTAQKKGFATQLITSLFEHQQQKHCRRILLEVAEKNLPAIQLYKKLGFSLIGSRKNYYQSGTDSDNAFVFEKLFFLTAGSEISSSNT